jgi:hypothetical protein
MWSECFAQWLVWLCTRSEKQCDPTEAAEIGHAIMKSKYDWIIRIRPDIEMVYSIPWPPLITGDIMSQLHSGNYDAYPWSKNLTTNYLASAQRSLFVSKNGCAPSSYTKPCFDLADQVALMKSSVAYLYFGYPASTYLDFHTIINNEDRLSLEAKRSLRESCIYTHAQDFPNENVLNNRLRREGVALGPIEFPFILPGPRKGRAHCPNGHTTLNTSLPSCFKESEDKHHIQSDMNIAMKFKELKHHCDDGGGSSSSSSDDSSSSQGVENKFDYKHDLFSTATTTTTSMTYTPVQVTQRMGSKTTIAVFVVGDHNIYDGTWLSHEKYLYQPIRKHKSTERLDIFVCQKEGEKLPSMMKPNPTAQFSVPKKLDQVCFSLSFLLFFCKVYHY